MNLALCLGASRLFHGLDGVVLDELARAAAFVTFAEGTYLWRSGTPADDFTVVQRGLVQVVRVRPDGEEMTLGIFGPHEGVGIVAALEGSNYPADAVAITASVEVIRIRSEVVHRVLGHNADLGRSVRDGLIDATRTLRAKIDVLGAGTVQARLAVLLLHLAERFGDVGEDGVLRVPVVLSRSMLARLVSARVETVIRTMSKWQKADFVRTASDGFEILALNRLEEAARNA